MPDILLHLLPAAAYAALGLHFWRSRWRRPQTQPLPVLRLWERTALAVALIAHGYVLHLDLFVRAGAMRFGFADALSLMLWLALVIYWIESFYARMEGLQTLALPLAAIAAALPAVFPGRQLAPYTATPLFRLHFLVAMIAYSLFILAALHAVLMATMETRLHGGALARSPWADLPPLLTMERLLFRLILIAFVLLTLTLVSGILFSENIFGRALSFNHKTAFSVVSWLIFAALLVGRHVFGWRGKLALRWTLAGVATLLLTFITHLVLEVMLSRPA